MGSAALLLDSEVRQSFGGWGGPDIRHICRHLAVEADFLAKGAQYVSIAKRPSMLLECAYNLAGVTQDIGTGCHPRPHTHATDQSHSTSIQEQNLKSKLQEFLDAIDQQGGDRDRAYTDGSSKIMFGHIRLGGFGVYYGEGDIRNVSQTLGGASQTNNRAELMAVIFAVAQQPADRGLHIITDSEWVYKGITQWVRVWARNDWKSTSRDVHHRDLWEQLIALTSGSSHPVTYQHVPSHIGVPGNEGADRLAEEGRMQHPYVLATQAREPSVHLH